MKILLLGSGGREHALAWKLAQSNLCSQLFIAPGNAGTLRHGINVALTLNDFEGIKKLCLDKDIDMLVIGPEEPLVKGLVDFLQSVDALKNMAIIGPSQQGAQLEGSKSFAKAFMLRHQVPTASYGEFDSGNYEQGIQYIKQHSLPIVLKADGLAAGKGVLICQSRDEAMMEFEEMIQKSKFGDASKKVVIESYLDGIELSVFALTDGKNYVILPEAKDYKRIGEGDKGLNTGGMGAVSPVPFADPDFLQKVEERVIRPTIAGLEKDGIPYLGFVFFGLIKVAQDPYCIEYNCRLGDPETEVVIPRLKNDLVELFIAATTNNLNNISIETDQRTACTVVAVSGGYPGDFEKGFEILGLENVENTDSLLFHAATIIKENKTVTNGGRVFCVSSFGDSIPTAALNSQNLLRKISFEKMYYRNDIGFEFQ
ncbi:MAG: phosphoribosylamine--glycine ligase [Chitinophagaceae bacterium]